MALIINIETATKNCSVSIAKNGELIALKELNDIGYTHGENLHIFIETVMNEAKVSFLDIAAVAVSMGPGSFTGLRIGVSAAKGLCFTLEKPLIAVNTLASLARAVIVKKNERIVPMLDARRMEVYSAVFDDAYREVRETRAEIIDENSFADSLKKGTTYFLGDGAEKCQQVIMHKNAVFLDGYFPSAKEMSQLSYEKYKKSDIEDVAYFEPFYLKDFLITKPKN